MRILMMGTPDFAIPTLDALVNSNHEVVGVISQQDKPKGRGHHLVPTPLKEAALSYGLPVYQPKTLKDEAFMELLTKLAPDLIVVVAYGKILPKSVLDFPRYGCVNVHASLLPKYRGAGPIQWSIINGETETGITTMQMGEGLDTGDILLQERVPITDDLTADVLFDTLATLGGKLLIETVKGLENGAIIPKPQQESEATYAPMLDKATGYVDFSISAHQVLRLIRGVTPWPSALVLYEDKRMKILDAKVVSETSPKAPGTILSVSREGILVACGKDCLLLTEIQMEGSKRMPVSEYLLGHTIEQTRLKTIL